ncbi:unnamed protein product [Pneumocystis jirovecii]|uniref:26S proteasome complex subunit SEM1 n=1 Tax=Pneumocystis jirovecii TaxID=42068 RepID=L0P8K1_PNEJI|nr:unnamed protein product [Pneumocystis jirovecii]
MSSKEERDEIKKKTEEKEHCSIFTENTSEDKKTDKNTFDDDDEFEEFPVEDWKDEDTDIGISKDKLWEDNWDDDDVEDEFSYHWYCTDHFS